MEEVFKVFPIYVDESKTVWCCIVSRNSKNRDRHRLGLSYE